MSRKIVRGTLRIDNNVGAAYVNVGSFTEVYYNPVPLQFRRLVAEHGQRIRIEYTANEDGLNVRGAKLRK